MRLRKNLTDQTGFGILEVIVAIFIITTGIVGILSLLNYHLKSASLLQQRLTASFLAQEGVETVRFVREAQNSWEDWLWYGSSGHGIGYSEVFRPQFDDTDLIARADSALMKDSSGFYRYDAGVATPFRRTVSLTKLSENELKVEVEVAWSDRGIAQTVRVEDRLWNWR